MLQVEKKNYIVAIDLGSQNVTAAAATRGADGKMVVEAVVRKPSGGVAGGAIENIENVTVGKNGNTCLWNSFWDILAHDLLVRLSQHFDAEI